MGALLWFLTIACDGAAWRCQGLTGPWELWMTSHDNSYIYWRSEAYTGEIAERLAAATLLGIEW